MEGGVPNRGQARPELQKLSETEEPFSSQSLIAQGGFEIAKVKANIWDDKMVGHCQNNHSSDQASPKLRTCQGLSLLSVRKKLCWRDGTG